MNHDENKKKQMMKYIAGSVLCLFVMGFFLLFNGDGNDAQQIDEYRELTGQVQAMEDEVKQKEGELKALAEHYGVKTGADAPLAVDCMDLNEDERQLLEEKIAMEKDVSTRSLLREILDKRQKITNLKTAIMDLENRLPLPDIAKKGDTHYQLAYTFLVDEKGVERKKAEKLLKRTAMFDQLAPGFKIWHFYTGSVYGTAVTQGKAKFSPNLFALRNKKKLMAAKEEAMAQRDSMAQNVETLTQQQEATEDQLNHVTREKESLKTTVATLNKKTNSLYYRVDSQKKLKKEGILKSGFLTKTKLKDIDVKNFNRSLDLTKDNQLTLCADELGVKQIKDVTLYPKFYKKDDSYKVLITKNQKYALLTLTDIEKFKAERVVIAVK